MSTDGFRMTNVKGLLYKEKHNGTALLEPILANAGLEAPVYTKIPL